MAVIDESGDIAKVTVRAITQRAGVSPTALYLHFTDREELVDTAIDAGFAAFNAATSRRRRARRTRVRGCCHGRRLPRVHRAPARAVLRHLRDPAEGPARAPRPVRSTGARPSTRSSRRWRRPGASEEGAEELAVALWSSLHGFAELRARGGPSTFPPGERFARRLLDAWI